jgi:ketosteroid isomerase-like protein
MMPIHDTTRTTRTTTKSRHYNNINKQGKKKNPSLVSLAAVVNKGSNSDNEESSSSQQQQQQQQQQQASHPPRLPQQQQPPQQQHHLKDDRHDSHSLPDDTTTPLLLDQEKQQQQNEEQEGGGVKEEEQPPSPPPPYNNNKNNVTIREEVVRKKIRVAKAQAEIDRILQGPDAPLIDTDAELEKVLSIHQIPSDHPLLDTQMALLESELYQAVKQQDFTMATVKQDQLEQLQHQHQQSNTNEEEEGSSACQKKNDLVDDGGAILQVNAAFYRAFSKKSYHDMDQVWLNHGHNGHASICIHPSHRPLVGARRISKSWKNMFESTDGSFQRNWMEPHQIRIVQQGYNIAIVTCEEHVFARRFVRGKKRQTELINKLLATNIFRKVNQQWYMCYHHASWHPDSEAAKRALNGIGTGSSGRVIASSSSDGDFTPTSSLAATLAARQRRRRRQLEDQDLDNDNDDDDEDSDDTTNVGFDGILGNSFGPVLGPRQQQGDNGKPFKRIVMGASLSDILNGGLVDLLRRGKDGAISNNKNNINNNGLPKEGAIIRFARMQEEDDDDDDDDEDDEDDEEDDDEEDDDDGELDMIEEIDDEEDDDGEGESVAIIKEWAKSSAKRHNRVKANENTKNSASISEATSSNDGKDKKNFNKNSGRQRCIKVLRKLGEQGTLSPRQKRVLLTDIITCSSRDEVSMVEVAYELLCGDEGEDKEDDAAEEEFADQCRVFAQERLQEGDREVFDK